MDVQNEMKPYVIGLDLGGTNSVFGIVARLQLRLSRSL